MFWGELGYIFLISGSFKMTERVSGASNVMVTIVSPVVIGSKTKMGGLSVKTVMQLHICAPCAFTAGP